jgi:hypothetical protein
MSEEIALVPVEQKTAIFYDDEIPVVLVEDGKHRQIFVPLRPICDFLGIDWSGQRQRIMRDPVLSGEAVPCVVITPSQGQPDQRREVQCLPLEFINGFLFGINASRVKDEVCERLSRYQRECYRVLAGAFLQPDAPTEGLTPSQTALVQIREMGVSIARVADEVRNHQIRSCHTLAA